MRRVLIVSAGLLTIVSSSYAQEPPATTLPPPPTLPLSSSVPATNIAPLNEFLPKQEDRTPPAQQRAQPARPQEQEDYKAEPVQPER
jgi:hypothetical protein